LSQKPALGYGFHPPAVAWSIALPQKLLGWLFGINSSVLVRLPSAFFSAGVMALGMKWMELAGAPLAGMARGALALLAFAGFFAASWMMVPDLPLMFGWMLCFVATWKLCFREDAGGVDVFLLFLGTVVALLSKYSFVLASFSSVVALFLWAPCSTRNRGWLAVVLGCVVAAVPILVWNSQHDWASILYQIRDRHGGETNFSGIRYARFWGAQLLFAGIPLVIYSFLLVRRVREHLVSRFVAVFVLPAALVFCLQPGWADFKPHWAFVVWLPVALELGWAWASGRSSKFALAQVAYGIPMVVVGLVLCHIPLGSVIGAQVSGREPDPRWDVTNDMYGWPTLRESLIGVSGTDLPVIGSRYQTASQVAFALGEPARVSFIPRDLKQMDEWPNLEVSDGQGPGWPRLLKPVLFVADNRYDEGPQFRDALCVKLKRHEARRGEFLVKWIDVWRCDPKS